MTIEEEYKQFVLNITSQQLVDINFSTAEGLLLEVIRLPHGEKTGFETASYGIIHSFLKNMDKGYQRYFLMALHFGCKFFEHKYLQEKSINDANANARAKSMPPLNAAWTRNFQFDTIEEANKKWEQVLKHRNHFVEYHFTYFHIDKLPDYVVSVSGSSYINMEETLKILEAA